MDCDSQSGACDSSCVLSMNFAQKHCAAEILYFLSMLLLGIYGSVRHLRSLKIGLIYIVITEIKMLGL